mmetsp:Transcript_3253/g.20227  ORF Transcript_3253/g.20227 Transcript_3253/m.20227 type:complete len:214 (-) Transcript_3253:497-1138(-)
MNMSCTAHRTSRGDMGSPASFRVCNRMPRKSSGTDVARCNSFWRSLIRSSSNWAIHMAQSKYFFLSLVSKYFHRRRGSLTIIVLMDIMASSALAANSLRVALLLSYASFNCLKSCDKATSPITSIVYRCISVSTDTPFSTMSPACLHRVASKLAFSHTTSCSLSCTRFCWSVCEATLLTCFHRSPLENTIPATSSFSSCDVLRNPLYRTSASV